jgi:hypothetical protein
VRIEKKRKREMQWYEIGISYYLSLTIYTISVTSLQRVVMQCTIKF